MSYHSVPLGKKSPGVINAIIEIPIGSTAKFEYDEELDEIRLDRVLHTPMHYPLDYGFVPQTRSEDGDHLDILVAVSAPLFSGCVIAVRPIGAIDMEDEAGQDWKIIGVAENDPRLREVRSIDDLGPHFKGEIQHFFEQYKQLEHKRSRAWLARRSRCTHAYRTGSGEVRGRTPLGMEERLFLFIGVCFGALAGLMAFLITYAEWQHHGFAGWKLWREPLLRGIYTFLFFCALSLFIGYVIRFAT